MSDIKLFALEQGGVRELHGEAAALEKSLQALIERNLEALLGVRFLSSEYATGPKYGGRIDTLGIDENGSPVIIEYKRATNENVINQGLFYLDWLLDHRAEFELLVLKQFGAESSDNIDWSGPRLLCIAGGFTKYDAHAVKQMNRNIELIQYRRFGEEFLLFELVNATTAQTGGGGVPNGGGASYKTISDVIEKLDGSLLDRYEELKAYLLALGDDVQEKTLKYYVAFKRIKNFACIEIHPTKSELAVFIKVDPKSIALEPGFTQDVSDIGHFGTGDLKVSLRSDEDLERAKLLFQKSYEGS